MLLLTDAQIDDWIRMLPGATDAQLLRWTALSAESCRRWPLPAALDAETRRDATAYARLHAAVKWERLQRGI